jgi:predicted short-subunit dehydrogenase-like oxidoreductase (DUF2520 family)
MTSLPSISIVGTGNVAQLFGQKFYDIGIEIASVVGRNEVKLKELSDHWNTKIEKLETISGDLILVAIPDESVLEIISRIDPNKPVFYTAGSINLQSISHPNCGVFYPLQTITKIENQKDIKFPLLIESKTESLSQVLFELANQISESVQYCDSEKRKQIHLSAVFINNFTNHMIYLGYKIAKQNSIAPSIYSDLLRETFEKLSLINPLDAQTGPARRNDLKTIRQQIEMLDETEKELYISITDSILKTYFHEKL